MSTHDLRHQCSQQPCLQQPRPGSSPSVINRWLDKGEVACTHTTEHHWATKHGTLQAQSMGEARQHCAQWEKSEETESDGHSYAEPKVGLTTTTKQTGTAHAGGYRWRRNRGGEGVKRHKPGVKQGTDILYSTGKVVNVTTLNGM